MKPKVKKILLFSLAPFLLFGLYIGSVLAYGTIKDFQPPPHTTIQGNEKSKIPFQSQDTIKLMTWNIGYAGLGAEMDFFYDGGTMVRPRKEWHDKYMNGIADFITSQNCDFYLLQELDSASKRSYYTNEFTRLLKKLPGYIGFFGLNYNAPFVPMPITEPLGKAVGGIVTYSRFACDTASRFTYPGEFEWPKRVFILDRCFLVNRFPMQNGKEFVLLNTHNSAYDEGGKMKKGEMEYLKRFLLTEYEKGNAVIAAGDWNQTPPGWKKFSNHPTSEGIEINPDFIPGWKWTFDPEIPTNRSLISVYSADTTRVNLIDYFLLSPNVNAISVKGTDLGFSNSDHNPVVLEAVISIDSSGLKP